MKRILRTASTAARCLAACAPAAPPRPAAAPPAPDPPQAAGPITLTDVRGKQITLPGPATRVVGLEWNVAEHAVSLGVMPVGVADVKGYSTWVTAEPLDAAVKDVGIRGEPSIDSIAALGPTWSSPPTSCRTPPSPSSRRFAPVVVVAGGDAKDNLGQMRRNLELVATATGKQAEAAALLAAFDAKVADGQGGARRRGPGSASRSPTATSRAARSRSGRSPRARCSSDVTERSA